MPRKSKSTTPVIDKPVEPAEEAKVVDLSAARTRSQRRKDAKELAAAAAKASEVSQPKPGDATNDQAPSTPQVTDTPVTPEPQPDVQPEPERELTPAEKLLAEVTKNAPARGARAAKGEPKEVQKSTEGKRIARDGNPETWHGEEHQPSLQPEQRATLVRDLYDDRKLYRQYITTYNAENKDVPKEQRKRSEATEALWATFEEHHKTYVARCAEFGVKPGAY